MGDNGPVETDGPTANRFLQNSDIRHIFFPFRESRFLGSWLIIGSRRTVLNTHFYASFAGARPSVVTSATLSSPTGLAWGPSGSTILATQFEEQALAPRRRHTLAEVLGPLEAEVMEVTWDRGEVTVRDVHEALNESRSVAYTTVMTTMGRLADKGLLRRVEDQRAHRFTPLLSREQYADSTVKSVVDWLVSQFRDPAVAYFLDRVEEEDEEVVEALKEAIEQRRRTQD